jgi:hypothetical protein
MSGVPRELAEHSFHVPPDSNLVKHSLCRFAEEKRKTISEEISHLLATGFIMELFYPYWLANLVRVMKKNKNDMFIA